MKFKYCPQCAAIDMKRLPNGTEECIRCHYVGTVMEGAMHEINAYKQQLKSGAVRTMAADSKDTSSSELGLSQARMQEKLKSLKGKKTEDFEIL